MTALKTNFVEFEKKYSELSKNYENLADEKERLEKANELLEESVRVAQQQKDLICEEQDQVQNAQLQEISKLKNLLLFREQEALDRVAVLKQGKQQVDQYKEELNRLQHLEPRFEDVKVRILILFNGFVPISSLLGFLIPSLLFSFSSFCLNFYFGDTILQFFFIMCVQKFSSFRIM